MLDKSFYLNKNLNKLTDQSRKVYFAEKNKIDTLNDYVRYRVIVFSVIKVFTLAMQMLEITIQGLLSMIKLIEEHGEEIEKEVKLIICL